VCDSGEVTNRRAAKGPDESCDWSSSGLSRRVSPGRFVGSMQERWGKEVKMAGLKL
jgi:hypothetical protein